MTRVRSVTAGIVVAGLLAGGVVAAAQGPRGGGPFGRGERGMMGPRGAGLALGAVELSDAQRDQVRAIRERHQEQLRAASQQLAAARDTLREAVETLPPNEGLIASIGPDLVQAEIDVAITQARINAEVWSVLTPEQQAQVSKARAEREARASERRQRLEQRRRQ